MVLNAKALEQIAKSKTAINKEQTILSEEEKRKFEIWEKHIDNFLKEQYEKYNIRNAGYEWRMPLDICNEQKIIYKIMEEYNAANWHVYREWIPTVGYGDNLIFIPCLN